MTWTKDSLPNVAKKWPEHLKAECVTIVNSALEDGATEREAIFACIGVMGNAERADVRDVPTPIEYAKTLRGNKKAPTIPPPPETKVQEAEYYRELKRMVNFQKRTIREIIMPEVPHILRKSRVDSPRLDDYVDDLENSMTEARAMFLEEYPPRRLEQMAAAAAVLTDNVNKVYYNKFYRIIGLNPLISEPWLAVKSKAFVADNVSLINNLTTDEYARVEGIVSRGAQSGDTVKAVESNIRATYPKLDNRAKLIAQDQIQKFNGSLNHSRQVDAGVTSYIWVSSGDERVRTTHRAFNTNVYSWKVGSPEGHPGMPVRCRCRAKPIIE